MTIIADSGSTKTTWMEVASGNMIVTEGLNPHFTTDERILAACSKVREAFAIPNSPLSIYFYGAGCGSDSQRQRVQHLLMVAFHADNVDVETDMLAACRAVSSGRPSLVGILGTGSNACCFDGRRIVFQPVSTGFILGDNGSANHVGRILLNDYLTHRMPQALRSLFHDVYSLSDAELMEAVYHRPNPNRFLASLAPFAVGHQDDAYCAEVIGEAISSWYRGPLATLCEQAVYPVEELNIVGGFARAVEPFLRHFFAATPLRLGTIVADPIDGLRRHHLSL